MNNLYLGIKGNVVCIDKRDGKELWRTKLRSDMSGVTNILQEENFIYAYVAGHLYCLDSHSGELKWENKLPRLGHGFGIMTSGAGAVSGMAAATAATAGIAASGAASSGGNGGC